MPGWAPSHWAETSAGSYALWVMLFGPNNGVESAPSTPENSPLMEAPAELIVDRHRSAEEFEEVPKRTPVEDAANSRGLLHRLWAH